MVDDEQRGKGIGSRIIAAVHEKYNTAARYRLEVTESNVRASALYHMLGFEDLGVQADDTGHAAARLSRSLVFLSQTCYKLPLDFVH